MNLDEVKEEKDGESGRGREREWEIDREREKGREKEREIMREEWEWNTVDNDDVHWQVWMKDMFHKCRRIALIFGNQTWMSFIEKNIKLL